MFTALPHLLMKQESKTQKIQIPHYLTYISIIDTWLYNKNHIDTQPNPKTEADLMQAEKTIFSKYSVI